MNRWLIDVLVVKLGPGLITAALLAGVTVLIGLELLDVDALHEGLHELIGQPLERKH